MDQYVSGLLIESVLCENRSLVTETRSSCLVSWIFAMAILLVWGHFGLLAASCLETVSSEVTWHRGAPRSLANSSLQNGSFHSEMCVPCWLLLPFRGQEDTWVGGHGAHAHEVDSVCYRVFPWFSTEDLFFFLSVGLWVVSLLAPRGQLCLKLQVIS